MPKLKKTPAKVKIWFNGPPLPSWPHPPSLHPDADTITDYISGGIEAAAITEAWRFNFPVTVLEAV